MADGITNKTWLITYPVVSSKSWLITFFSDWEIGSGEMGISRMSLHSLLLAFAWWLRWTFSKDMTSETRWLEFLFVLLDIFSGISEISSWWRVVVKWSPFRVKSVLFSNVLFNMSSCWSDIKSVKPFFVLLTSKKLNNWMTIYIYIYIYMYIYQLLTSIPISDTQFDYLPFLFWI